MDSNVESIEVGNLDHIELAAGIVCAYLSNNRVQIADVPGLIVGVYAALTELGDAGEPPGPEKPTPAQIRKSITHEALISFEDGKPYKTLKRHLALRGLTPEAYRANWGLDPDYPMTAAAYSEQRSALAKNIGLGQIRNEAAVAKAKSREPIATAPVAEAAPERPKTVARPRKAKNLAEA